MPAGDIMPLDFTQQANGFTNVAGTVTVGNSGTFQISFGVVVPDEGGAYLFDFQKNGASQITLSTGSGLNPLVFMIQANAGNTLEIVNISGAAATFTQGSQGSDGVFATLSIIQVV